LIWVPEPIGAARSDLAQSTEGASVVARRVEERQEGCSVARLGTLCLGKKFRSAARRW